MLKNLWRRIRNLFWIELEQEPEEEPQIPHYNVPETWPFQGHNAPDQLAIHTLQQGLQSVGDHIFCGENRKRSIRTPSGIWPVKMLVWWISGNPVEAHASSVRSTCGERSCCRPDHLEVVYGSLPEEDKKPEVVFQKMVIPESKKKEDTKRDDTPKNPKADYSLLSGDRSICVSAKVHFPTELAAARAKNEFNNKIRKPGARRLYIYDCDWCSGWHLTKQNPKTRKVYKHPGSWVS